MAALLNESYRYSPDGNLIGSTRAGDEVLAYEYDGLNRLTGVDRAHDGLTIESDWSVTYDPSGNRLTQTTEREASTYVYAPGVPGHRLMDVSPSGSGPHLTWAYNVDGSVSSRSEEILLPGQTPQATEAQEFTYTWQDRVRELRTARPAGPGQPDTEAIVNYDYDAAGREIKRTEGSTTTRYVRDAWGNVRAELNGSGAIQCWWVVPGKGGGPELCGGGQDGDRAKTPLVVLDATQEPVAYLHPDRIGTVRGVTSPEGDELLRLNTLPFGEKIRREETVPGGLSPAAATALKSAFGIGFAGQREEEANEGLRFEARWYDTATGRFGLVDPEAIGGVPKEGQLLDPQLLHAYAYAGNAPFAFTDPDGRFGMPVAPWMLPWASGNSATGNVALAATLVLASPDPVSKLAGAGILAAAIAAAIATSSVDQSGVGTTMESKSAGDVRQVSDSELKARGIDAEAAKEGIVGSKLAGDYNISVDKKTGKVVLTPVKKGSGENIEPEPDQTLDDLRQEYPRKEGEARRN